MARGRRTSGSGVSRVLPVGDRGNSGPLRPAGGEGVSGQEPSPNQRPLQATAASAAALPVRQRPSPLGLPTAAAAAIYRLLRAPAASADAAASVSIREGTPKSECRLKTRRSRPRSRISVCPVGRSCPRQHSNSGERLVCLGEKRAAQEGGIRSKGEGALSYQAVTKTLEREGPPGSFSPQGVNQPSGPCR